VATSYAGALCGPKLPCTVLVDEQAANNGTFSVRNATFGDFGDNQAPAVALDGSCAPHVLGSMEEGGTVYSVRDPAVGWQSEITPLDKYSGSMVLGPNGAPLAVVHDGNYNTTLWTRSGQWTKIDQIPGQVAIYGQGLGIDASGALHAALWDSTSKPATATYAGGWTTVDGDVTASSPVLTVSSTAAAHLAYWEWMGSPSQVQSHALFWWSPPDNPELVDATLPVAGAYFEIERLALATSAPDAGNPAGKPHLVYARSLDGSSTELVYATRVHPGEWALVSFVQAPSPASQNPCSGTSPTAPGQTCSYDLTVQQPVAIAASQDGEARMFYDAARFTGAMTAQCSSSTSCVWANGASTRTDTLEMAWSAGGSVQTATLVQTGQPSVATVAIDTAGAMHLALFEAKGTSPTLFSTRYLRIGSP
jgi:hypothetical protein